LRIWSWERDRSGVSGKKLESELLTAVVVLFAPAWLLVASTRPDDDAYPSEQCDYPSIPYFGASSSSPR